MKRRFVLLLLASLVGVAVAGAPGQKPVRVFVLCGQSNMQGQAVADLAGKDYNDGKGTLRAALADPDKFSTYSHLVNPDGSWRVRNDVFVRYQREEEPLLAGPLGLGFSVYGDTHHFGVELQFGHVVGDALGGPVLLIKTAWGGKSLYTDFRPPSSGGEVGKYYKLTIQQIQDGLGKMGTDFPQLKGRKAELAGFVWWQGWNDGVDPKHAVPEYEQNLVNFIHDVRHDLHSPKLPFVVGELTGPWVKAPGEWDTLRRAQAAAAQQPEFKGNVLFVPTHDFVRKPEDSPNPTHGHHEFGNAETYFLVGDALGKGALKLMGISDEIQMKDYGLKHYVRLSKALPHMEDRSWRLVCKMPYNCQSQPWIRVKGRGGEQLQFNSTNPLVQYLTPTETCTLSPGRHDYEAKNWVSGEGSVYTIPAGVTVEDVQYRETGFPTSVTGSFECSDPDFNTLWNRAARTAYLCMRDHFYDCPDRERVGFWGDGTPELDQCFYIFDSNSHRLCRDLVRRKLEPTFYPGQHLEFLGEYGLWFYYMQTGDLDSLRAVYPATKNFLLKTYAFGNKGTWFDWGKDIKDTSVIENCFEYIDLGTLEKIAKVTGHAADIPEIEARRAAIQASFNQKYWKGKWYQSSDVATPDDRANAMAVNAGLAEPEKWESIYRNVLSTTTYSSSFFDRWVVEALCKMGKQEKALARMSTRYRTMIQSPITTLWEHYDRWWASWIDAFDEGSSLNHGWNPPAIVLSKDIAGIQPTEPGWTQFEVMPGEAHLTSIKVVVPTVKGKIPVEIAKSGTEYRVTVTAPAGTTAIVGIPMGSFSRLDSISANGRLVWDGQYARGPKGVKAVGIEDDYVKFSVPTGTWSFIAKGLLPVAAPKVIPITEAPEVCLDTHRWVASASVPDAMFTFSGANLPVDGSAANALDGDHWTGWRDKTKTQYPGQWFQVDMQRRETFDKIELENAWAVWDSPKAYAVTVSEDGQHWSQPIATGKGQLGLTVIRFPSQTARYIRVTQTASDPTYFWSIYEFSVSRKKS